MSDDTQVDKQVRRVKEKRYSALQVILPLTILSFVSLLLDPAFFYALGGLTLVIIFIVIIKSWDDIVVWWATRGKR